MKKEKKTMSIDTLTRMVQAGFSDVHKRLDGVKSEMATKKDIERLEGRISDIEGHTDRIEGRLGTMKDQILSIKEGMATKADIRRLEEEILRDQNYRINNLETDVKMIKEKIEMK